MRLAFAALAAIPAFAHVVSMSTGEVKLDGTRLTFELRMPAYEAAHVANPATDLLNAMDFRPARELSRSCGPQGDTYVCRAEYEFPAPPERLDVTCRLASVTVPNHVHMLRATNGDKSDQAAFDASFTKAQLRFRPPTGTELAVRDMGAGFWRALSGPAQLLFVLALAVAARRSREMAALCGAFALGQVLACVVAIHARFWLSPRFLEAAAALTIAYLAVEVLFLRDAGGRWAVAGALGVIHGVYFAMTLAAGGWAPALFLAGALAAESMVAAVVWGVSRIARHAAPTLRWQTGFASALLAVGLGWFVLRLGS
jgi:hypothetical protein